MPKLFIYGFPGLYAGAATELHHQIHVWSQINGLQLVIIPMDKGYKNEPLYQEMLDLGVEILEPHQFDAVTNDDAVINFCSSMFLDNVSHIFQFTRRTIFVNCMTFLFNDEKKSHQRRHISFSLYQRPQILENHRQELETLGSKADFLQFIPYFRSEGFNFSCVEQDFVHIGRISRDAKDKYTKFNGPIYEGIISPKLKCGHYLGFGPQARSITGTLPNWIKTYRNQNEFLVKDFYSQVDFIVQPTNTTENWPRIGLEAMHTGTPLVVDNKGGWQYMIEHGVTGFLCNHERDFMYYGSRLAYDFDLRQEIAHNAYQKGKQISGLEESKESWRKIFEKVFN